MDNVDLKFECITYVTFILNDILFTLHIEKQYETLFKLWKDVKKINLPTKPGLTRIFWFRLGWVNPCILNQ